MFWYPWNFCFLLLTSSLSHTRTPGSNLCSCTDSVCINVTACTNNTCRIRPTLVSIQTSRNTSGIVAISTLGRSLTASWQDTDTSKTLLVFELPPKEPVWEKKKCFQALALQTEQGTPLFFIYSCVPGKQHSWPSLNPYESADIPHRLSASPSTCVCILGTDVL